MRIGLVGVGRIGAFHAATLKGVAGGGPGGGRRCRREPGRAGRQGSRPEFAAGRRRVAARADLDGFVIAAATSAHAELIARGRRRRPPDVLREAGRRRPGRHPERGRAGRGVRRAGAHRLPAPLRRRLPGRRGEQVRSGELGFVHHIRANTNDAFPPPRGVHPDQRRLLPRLHRARLRHHPLRHRPRGGQRLRDRREPRRVLLRRVRRRRRGRRAAHPRRQHLRLGQRHPLQRRRPRRPDGGARQPRLDRGRPGRAHRAAVGRGRRHLPRRARRTPPSWTASGRRTSPS